MKASLNWLTEYVGKDLSAEQVADNLTMCGLEVQGIEATDAGNDTVVEVEITSNRPDWLSHLGIARELGATVGCAIHEPDVSLTQSRIASDSVRVKIEDADQCPYYSAVLLENVSFGETPDFIKDRLRAVGLRPINFPVDLTNYVLYEYGQPLHAFDFDAIGNAITVRSARKDEKFLAINDKEYVLTEDDLVIADEKNALALAGVMGGKLSEVCSATKNILLESAFFAPTGVRRTSRVHQLMSDSSYRFERRVDPAGVVTASERFIQLFLKYATIEKISTVFSAGELPESEMRLDLSFSYVDSVLGHRIPRDEMQSIMKNLGLSLEQVTTEGCVVLVPSFRGDLERPIDLVEEIARIYGYDNIPETYPRITMQPKVVEPLLKLENCVRAILSGSGMNEIITFSLVNPAFYQKFAPALLDDAVVLINPSNKELSLMRPSMITGMLDVVKTNINHGNKTVKAFELGRVYTRVADDLPREDKIVSIAYTGEAFNNWTDKSRDVTFYDLKGMIEYVFGVLQVPTCSFVPQSAAFCRDGLAIVVDGVVLGFCGEVSQTVRECADIKQKLFYAELNLTQCLSFVQWEKKFIPYSKYPASVRDLSMTVTEDVGFADIVTKVIACGEGLIKNVSLFDQYKGKQIKKGYKSLSFAIEYQSTERTLSSEEIEGIQNTIIATLKDAFNAELRS